MKKSILFFTCLLCACFSWGQFVPDRADLPVVGLQLITGTDTTISGINVGGPSSLAQTWDFSALTADYPSTPYYEDPITTPFGADFPDANLYTYGPAAFYGGLHGGAPVGTQGMNKGWMYWRADSTGFWIVGFRADSGAYADRSVLEAPRELVLPSQISLGDSIENEGRWVFPMNLNSLDFDTFYVSHVWKTFYLDGFGDLTVPGPQSYPVVRIREEAVKVDSVVTKMGATTLYSLEVLRDTVQKIHFLAENIGFPIATAHFGDQFLPNRIEFLVSRFLGNETGSPHSGIHAYPNPFIDKIFLSWVGENHSNRTLQILDVQGRVVHSEQLVQVPGENSWALEGSNLARGMYLVVLSGTEGVQTQTLWKAE